MELCKNDILMSF